MVGANLIEQDYPTKAFRITELGRQVIRRSALRQREMEFLVQSGIFRDDEKAVQAAIHLWLGLMRYGSREQLVHLLPIRMDRNGHLLGIPQTKDDWRKLEEAAGTFQKVAHDSENELTQTLRAFVRKHRGEAGLVFPRTTTDVIEFWNKAWSQDAVNSLMIAFASDRQMVETEIEFLKKFLKATYPDGIDETALENLSYDNFRSFKRRFLAPDRKGDAKI